MGTRMYADVSMLFELFHDGGVHLATTVHTHFEIDVPAHSRGSESDELKASHEYVRYAKRVEKVVYRDTRVDDTLTFSSAILVHSAQ